MSEPRIGLSDPKRPSGYEPVLGRLKVIRECQSARHLTQSQSQSINSRRTTRKNNSRETFA